MTTREIEELKHRASWFNSLGTAVISGGIIAPFVAFVTNHVLTKTGIGVMLIMSGIALWAGFALHEAGAKVINEIAT